MIRLPAYALFALTCFAMTRPAWADHFAIDLEVKAPEPSKKVRASSAGAAIKPGPRPVLETKAGARLTTSWTVKSTADKDARKDFLVHFFVVRQEKVGQEPMPRPNKGVLAESALSMDFNPKDKTEGELSLVVDRPGVYLVRVETFPQEKLAAAGGPGDPEDFAALDLVVR